MSGSAEAPSRLDRVLASASSRAALRALSPRSEPLTTGEVRQVASHLRGLDEQRQPLKVGVIRTFTTEPLGPYWTLEGLLHGFEVSLHEAPYGSTFLEASTDSQLAAFSPDCTFVLLQWEDLAPALARPVAGLSAEEREQVASEAVESTTAWLEDLREVVGGAIVVGILPALACAELGIHEPMAVASETAMRARVRDLLATHLRERLATTYLADLDAVLTACGRSAFFDRRLWFSARFPFGVAGAQAVVRHLFAFAVVAARGTAKCIVLDADNTLWGGVLGEDGVNGIALGPEYPGSAYVAFQRRLEAFRSRGILLALCTRNDPDDVEQLLRDHPHQVLRSDAFAAVSTGWGAKPEGIAAIARDLNLGTDTLLYVDDSPQECHEVETVLPEVDVVTTPTRLVDLPTCLDDIARLEVLALTDEDRRRPELYAQERARRDNVRSGGAGLEHLARLDMHMTIAFDDRDATARISQLTQRTNQFNLTTHRYTEAEIEELIADDRVLVAHCSLRDIFGDSGIVGVAIVRISSELEADVDTFLLSCRVIGRKAETAFLSGVLERVAQLGVTRVRATYLPTAKNHLVETFWDTHGFTRIGDDPATYEVATAALPTLDAPIALELIDARQSV